MFLGPRAALSPPGQVLSPSPGQALLTWAPRTGGRGSPRKLGAGSDSMAVGGWREAAERHLPAKAAREQPPCHSPSSAALHAPHRPGPPWASGEWGRGSETRAAQRVGFPPQTQERKRCGTCTNQGAARGASPASWKAARWGLAGTHPTGRKGTACLAGAGIRMGPEDGTPSSTQPPCPTGSFCRVQTRTRQG